MKNAAARRPVARASGHLLTPHYSMRPAGGRLPAFFRLGATAAAVAALLCLPITVATASVVPVGFERRHSSDFLTRMTAQMPQAAMPHNKLFSEDLLSMGQGPGATRGPLAAKGLRSSDEALWAMVASTQGEGEGSERVFQIVDPNTASFKVALLGDATPANVPLPGVTWLFVMSVMGIAGVRMNGSGPKKSALKAHIPDSSDWAQLPAAASKA